MNDEYDNNELMPLRLSVGDRCCASCGITEVDDIELKECDACKIVRYCSDECQKEHRSKHEEECKTRAAELRDELLFKQPESSHLGDCPICCLPQPLYLAKPLNTCCSKVICLGCNYTNQIRELKEKLMHSCPFCRSLLPRTLAETRHNVMKRAEVNDPGALRDMGLRCYHEGDYDNALGYWTKAAELGDITAHYQLSILFVEGGVVEKDEQQKSYHLEEAAIGGHPAARHNLGCYEWYSGSKERAVKHFIIAANLGFDDSMEHAHGYI